MGVDNEWDELEAIIKEGELARIGLELGPATLDVPDVDLDELLASLPDVSELIAELEESLPDLDELLMELERSLIEEAGAK